MSQVQNEAEAVLAEHIAARAAFKAAFAEAQQTNRKVAEARARLRKAVDEYERMAALIGGPQFVVSDWD